MYPLSFKPIYKEMIWGGSKLRSEFKRTIPSDSTGESWDISCRDNEMGIVKNGRLAGEKFIDVLNLDRKGYLGTSLFDLDSFPLLVKLIDAKDNLSVQVHPNDEYAQKAEGYVFGKSEMWYVLDAPKEGFLIIGLDDGVTKEKFKQAIEDETVEKMLGKLYVKKGDIINIPSGLVHAITKGVMIAEIQQNSDITYRVYDYKRVDASGNQRQLHVDKALDVIDFEGKLNRKAIEGLSIVSGDNKVTYYIANKYFAIEKYEIKQNLEEQSDESKFYIFTCVEGACDLEANGHSVKLSYGDSVFIPANLGKYIIKGNCVLIKSYVPNIENDFIKPLTNNGFTQDDLRTKISIEN